MYFPLSGILSICVYLSSNICVSIHLSVYLYPLIGLSFCLSRSVCQHHLFCPHSPLFVLSVASCALLHGTPTSLSLSSWLKGRHSSLEGTLCTSSNYSYVNSRPRSALSNSAAWAVIVFSVHWYAGHWSGGGSVTTLTAGRLLCCVTQSGWSFIWLVTFLFCFSFLIND